MKFVLFQKSIFKKNAGHKLCLMQNFNKKFTLCFRGSTNFRFCAFFFSKGSENTSHGHSIWNKICNVIHRTWVQLRESMPGCVDFVDSTWNSATQIFPQSGYGNKFIKLRNTDGQFHLSQSEDAVKSIGEPTQTKFVHLLSINPL